MSKHKCAILLPLVLVCLILTTGSYGQTKYSAKDSVDIYQLLTNADNADMEGKMNEAIDLVNDALERSKKKSFLRGQAYAWLKMADLKLKTDGTTNLNKYYKEAEAISNTLQDNFLKGLIAFQKSQQKSGMAEYDSASALGKAALHYFQLADSIHYQAYAFNELGFIEEKLGDYEKANENNLKAITLFEKVGDIKEAANTRGNQAIIYYRLNRKTDALQMFKESAAIREKMQDIKGLAATYGNIAVVYTPINEDSALRYYGLQLLNAQKSGVKANIAQAYANNVTILNRQERYAEALELEMKAIQLYNEIGNKNKLGARYSSAAILHHKVNDSLGAEKYFALAEETGIEMKSKPILQNLYLYKSEFYKDYENYPEALSSLEKYYLYKDSLINENTASNIAELQLKYDTEKKDNEINRLQAATKIQELELEHQETLILNSSLESERREQDILLLIQDQKLKDEDIKLKEELLTRQALVVKNNEQQLKIAEQEQQLKDEEIRREKLIRSITIGVALLAMLLVYILFSRFKLKRKLQEHEKILKMRDNISKDLHDEIGSTLTSINILSNISQQAFTKDPGQAKLLIGKISEQTKAIQQNMSDIVWALRPENERMENMEARMREFASQTLERNHIKTVYDFDDKLLNQALPQESRKDMLLIFKEAITNIVKHANASEVKIALQKKLNSAELAISDNGVGIQEKVSTGTGTKSMEQRAKAIGGILSIEAQKRGTTVRLTIPLT